VLAARRHRRRRRPPARRARPPGHPGCHLPQWCWKRVGVRVNNTGTPDAAPAARAQAEREDAERRQQRHKRKLAELREAAAAEVQGAQAAVRRGRERLAKVPPLTRMLGGLHPALAARAG